MDEPQVKFSRLDEQGRWVLIGNYNCALGRTQGEPNPSGHYCMRGNGQGRIRYHAGRQVGEMALRDKGRDQIQGTT